ncbi:MAG TPA: phosphate ABC transporter substrate-binding protein PstS [Aquabacterium sp.]|uniref:phosphate ABC transporter substrate-binding protein PstS n=1 Tax=Aquabacterium sp. TaxID=1872578 RepID=UPI002E30BDDC|nr:phosphate ABC transporter substrate-binding protein PstS [Aquabacterium sp.]HEX5357526.1 phosphate ABC transporter substrate-binding protein PstS [Aquabacterium sp.]
MLSGRVCLKPWGALLLALSTCLTAVHVHAEVQIKGAGASFPSHVYERWTKRFADLNPGVSVRYVPTGSGDGIKQIKARSVHLGGTDNPLTPQQLAEHKLVQIPMLVGGLVPVVNVQGIGANQLVLSGEVLADIMQGQIRQWDDPRIAALNPGLRLPAQAITRIVREDASGSTEVWTRYLGMSSSRFAAAVPASQKPTWPGATLAAKGNDGVSALLKDTAGGVSYVSFDRVQKDRLSGVKLRTSGGFVVAASEEAFRAAILASDLYKKGDDVAGLLSQPRADAWPLTATSYVLLDAAPKDMHAADWVARFVYWCFMHGDELTRGTGFAPLPERVQARLSGRLLQIHGPAGQVPSFATP